MLRDRRYNAAVLDASAAGPDIRSGLGELRENLGRARLALVVPWWDVTAVDLRRDVDFILYKPLRAGQALPTLQRLVSPALPPEIQTTARLAGSR